MLRKLSFRVGGRDAGLRLDQFLAVAVPAETGEDFSRRRARRLIGRGAAYIDGRRIKVVSRAVRRGQRVDLYLDESGPGRPASEPEIDIGRLVLYEDEHLLVIDKPSGLAAQATLEDDHAHLLAHARRFLERSRPRERPELALPHRLDRGTSGVQVLTKTRVAAARLTEAFRERRVEKRYLALCLADGPLEDTWTVKDRLALRSPGPGRPRKAEPVLEGGRPAETRFTLLERFPGAALVRAEPRTGRTHQIRVHLADRGHAVLGDRLYGPPRPAVRAPRLMLHAAEIRLEHPLNGKPLRIESPLPGDFQALIERLSSSMASP